MTGFKRTTGDNKTWAQGGGKAARRLDKRAFLQCTLCVAAKYSACCRFCGMKCYKKHLQRHKEWHTERDEAMVRTAASVKRVDPNKGRKAAEREAAAPDEYTRLCSRSVYSTPPTLPTTG